MVDKGCIGGYVRDEYSTSKILFSDTRRTSLYTSCAKAGKKAVERDMPEH